MTDDSATLAERFRLTALDILNKIDDTPEQGDSIDHDLARAHDRLLGDIKDVLSDLHNTLAPEARCAARLRKAGYTDDARAIAEALAKDWVIHGLLRQGADAIEQALLASQSSWAKEKAELERQLAEASKYLTQWRRGQSMDYDACKFAHDLAERHASRPVTAKE